MRTSIYSFDSKIGDRELPLKLVRREPQADSEEHSHEFSELVVVYGGEGTHHAGGRPDRPLRRGSVMALHKGLSHKYSNCKGLALVNVLYAPKLLPMPFLDARTIPGMLRLLAPSAAGSAPEDCLVRGEIPESGMKELLAALERLEKELESKEPGFQFGAMAAFMQIALQAARAFEGPSERDASGAAGISAAMGHLHKSFNRKLDMEELSKLAMMSKSSLYRGFKRMTGSSPKEYLLELRLNCAAELLLATSLDVREIAFRSGFEDNNYFARKFKESCKLSPSAYRKLLKKEPAP